MHDDIFEALENGSTIITVNARLARMLHSGYAARVAASGAPTWTRPDILSYGAWLQRCWDDALDRSAGREQAVLLTSDQELLLWERIIEQDEAGTELLQTPRTARLAAEAWSVSQNWGIDLSRPSLMWSEDAKAFSRWMDAFNRVCMERDFLPEARLPFWLMEQFDAGVLPVPERIRLAGFDELSPLQQDFFDSLRKAGASVRHWEPPAVEAEPVLLAAADADDELHLAARWARAKLEAAAGADVSIGVVVQSLAAVRDRAERIFTEVFYPEAVLNGPDPAHRAFNLSAGRPLDESPVIDAAFLVFALARECMSWEDAGRLLRSPFIDGGVAERESRSLLDSRLRRRGHLTVSRESFSRLAAGAVRLEDGSELRCEILAGRFQSAIKYVENQPAAALPSHWSSVLPELLRRMGWPGDRSPNSPEYQAVMAWKTLFARLGSLDALLGDITLAEAVGRLRRMSRETLFQPRGGNAPVQIIGVLEASGMSFDHLWLAGFHDEAWPEPPAPNPFLPLDQQKSKEIPHASAERELKFAQRVTQRLLGSAPEIVVSYAAREEDRDLQPSRLVGFPRVSPDDLGLAAAAAEPAAPTLELVTDFQGPALGEDVASRGGARVFELQAKCPFRAFAEIRLASDCLEVPAGRFDAREKGSLVHRAAQLLWEHIGSHRNLVSLEQPEEPVREAVRQAIEEHRARNPECYTPRFAAVETERLRRLLLALLELERGRMPFKVIAQELIRDATAGGVTVTTRVDRIDELEEGGHVFIDYKTGSPSASHWLGERPEEPQLPLYAITSREDVAAVAFAQVNAKGVQFCGFQQEKGLVPGLNLTDGSRKRPPDWQSLLNDWREAMERIGRSFCDGDARVDPKNVNQTCRYCPQTSFCRKHEVLLYGGEENGNEG